MEYKMKSLLIRTSCAVILCLFFIILKFIFKEEKILEEIYKYLATDIVFL